MARPRRILAAYGKARSMVAERRDRNGDGQPDYADAHSWMFRTRHPVQAADIFYIPPSGSGTAITDRVKADARAAFLVQGSAFAEYCNIFVPYYRPLADGTVPSSAAAADIFAAVEYYFTHLNRDRPFILAGYREGSALVMSVLETYLKDHPEQYGRMVAAYPIGWRITRDWFENNPHLKPAAGRTDTGVVVAWTMDPSDRSDTAASACIINPLTWTTDGTYGDTSLNKGTLVSIGSETTIASRISIHDAKTSIRAGLCDARIDDQRGILVSTPSSVPVAAFGCPEYTAYYENIRNNGYDRITAFLGHRPLIGLPMDYSRRDNWMFQDTGTFHAADLFYIYPTVDYKIDKVLTSLGPGIGHTADGRIGVSIATTSTAVFNVNLPGKEEKETAKAAFVRSGEAFAPYTNVFVPYYRQIPMDRISEYTRHDEDIDFLRKTRARTDIFAALDYYFQNFNHGRPFILAGHSQGSALLHIVLDEYMARHPEYYRNMVAAYLIGFGTEEAWFAAHPHLKPAAGETDTGVVVSWNSEGPDAQQDNLLIGDHPTVINPLTWTTDETYGDRSQNPGSLVRATDGTFSIVPGIHDARIDASRHVLVCTTDTKYMDDRSGVQFTKMFGEKSLHNADYKNYFASIRENGRKRIEAFLAHGS